MKISLPSSLLFALLLTSTSNAASIWAAGGGPSRSNHAQLPASRTFTSRMRDLLVRAIWPGCHETSKEVGNLNKAATASLPEYILKKYGSDKVLRFELENDRQRQAIAEAADTLFLDVWDFTKDWVDIRLSKDTQETVFGLLPSDMKWQAIIPDLASTVFHSQDQKDEEPTPRIAGERPLSQGPREGANVPASRTNLFFQKYQPLNVIVPWMRLLRSLFPTHVRQIDIGTSWEGRAIPALRVGNHPHNAEEPQGPRKVIVVAGGLHAREWISTSSVNYAAYQLITGYGRSREITKLIEEFDFVFIPTLNPDGYVYTWEEDRLWRKNRQSTKFSFCPGVDLDRSFDFQWDGENTMGNPCSENYAGEGPFDAHESVQFADWVKNRTDSGSDQIVGFFDLHSYSQQILYPFSYTCEHAPGSWEDLQEVGLGLEKAIYATTYKRYTTTSACEGGSTLWPREMNGGGTLLDWALSQGVKYSYQLKLRDTGSYGFLLPAKEIVPTGKEVFAAVQYFAQYLLNSASVATHEESPSSQEPVLSPGLHSADEQAERERKETKQGTNSRQSFELK